MHACRVAVGIPSYCEADSIAHVVAQVDAGLARRFGASQGTIVNVDGASPDGTTGVFLNVPTKCPKESIVVSDAPGGKGRNVLEFLRVLRGNGDRCPGHHRRRCGQHHSGVGPRTARSGRGRNGRLRRATVPAKPFRGRRDRALCVPVRPGSGRTRPPSAHRRRLRSVDGLARHLLRQPVDEAAKGYGIDVFMSLHATRGAFRLGQALLGQKRHKPSFPRRSRIFHEVVTTALSVTRPWELAIRMEERRDQPSGIDETREFPHRDAARQELPAARAAALALMPVYRGWLGRDAHDLEASIAGGMPRLSAQEWTDILAAAVAVQRADLNAGTAGIVAGQLYPLFSIRSMTLWSDSVAWPPSRVEAEIRDQARLLRQKLVAREPIRGERRPRHRLSSARW
jgi:hypothetical protein